MSVSTLTPIVEDAMSLTDAQEEAQRVFELLANVSQEAQGIVLSRLLAGLTAKMSGPFATKIIEQSKVLPDGLNQKSSRNNGSNKKTTTPRSTYESQLGKLDNPLDPFEAWEKLGGADGLTEILPHEQIGVLWGMLEHPNMPPGKDPRGNTSKAVSTTIIQRLKNHFLVK